jgi:hypothetical protein
VGKPSSNVNIAEGEPMTARQQAAAKRNIKKAAAAAKRKQTLKHLPKKTRKALGKQAAKVRQKVRQSKRG